MNALLLALLVSGAAAEKHPPLRPKTPAPKPAPKPPPPPPEDPDDDGYVDPPEPEDQQEVIPRTPAGDDDDPFRKPRGARGTNFSEEQLQMIGGATLCTCFCFFVGIIALIVFLVKRASGGPKPAAAQPVAPVQPAAAPIPFHLSVFALGMHAGARQLVAQQLILAGVQADPVSAPERAQLVRELSKALRGLESEWTHFGYGERLDLPDDASAQRSYQLAVDDFSKRSADPSLSGESSSVVVTLVLCMRRQLRGVTTLDDRAQIRMLLEDRSALSEAELMGAYLVWSQPLGGHEVLTRFPEMHAVR